MWFSLIDTRAFLRVTLLEASHGPSLSSHTVSISLMASSLSGLAIINPCSRSSGSFRHRPNSFQFFTSFKVLNSLERCMLSVLKSYYINMYTSFTVYLMVVGTLGHSW